MRKYALLITLLTLLTYSTPPLTARAIGIKKVALKGPVKNIPPPVLKSLDRFLTAIDVSDYEISIVTRDQNSFRITIVTTIECDGNTIISPMVFTILANGKIIAYSVPECIKIPPDEEIPL